MITLFQTSNHILEISWPQEIIRSILIEKITLQKALEFRFKNHLAFSVSGYHVLTLVFKNPIDKKSISEEIIEQYNHLETESYVPNYWNIPVYYDGKDLEQLAYEKKCSVQEIISLHTAPEYLLHFYGFMPGFIYLGGLDGRLHQPRKGNPERKVAAGSVAIGGTQTGIYPLESPGGWHIIGTCPIKMFDPQKSPPVWGKEGDIIKFYSITNDAFIEMRKYSSHQLINKTFNG